MTITMGMIGHQNLVRLISKVMRIEHKFGKIGTIII